MGKTVYLNLKGRLGNQFFQYWCGKWVADQLNATLKINVNEPFQINLCIYPNVRFNITHHVPVNIDPDNGQWAGHDDYSRNSLSIEKIVEMERIYEANPQLNKGRINRTVYLDGHFEDYSIIRPHTDYVKNLFKRAPSYQQVCNNHMVVHLRLGDVASNNSDEYLVNNYIALAVFAMEHTVVPMNLEGIYIISEELNHPIVEKMVDALAMKNGNVKVRAGDYQSDFDVISSAKVIVASNSTFSWWASFTNPFDPVVYIGLSEKQPVPTRNETLFRRDSPDSWNLWDMDARKFL